MPNTARLGYIDPPLGSTYDDPTVGLAALGVTMASGVVASITVDSTARFHQTLRFNLLMGLRDGTTGIYANREKVQAYVTSSTTLAVVSRSDNTRTHAVGESLQPVPFADDMANNPGPLTTTGSFPWLAASGAMGELLAPADGNYALNFATKIPSYVSAPTWDTLATPPTSTALGSSGAPFYTLNVSGLSHLGPSDSGLPDPLPGWAIGQLTVIGTDPSNDAGLSVEYAPISGTAGNGAISAFAYGPNAAALNVDAATATNGSMVRTLLSKVWVDGATAAVGYGAQILNPQILNGGSFATVFGVNVEDVTASGATAYSYYTDMSAGSGKWAFYGAGTANSSFGGSVTATDFIPTSTRAAHLFYAGPASGSAAVPTWRAMVAGDVPDLSATYATPGSVITYVGAQGFTTAAAVVTYVSGSYVPLTRSVNGHALSADVTVTKSDLSLGSVENTALSTWVGTTNITILGTIATGTWSGTAIAANKGGTGQTVYVVGDLLQASTTSALSQLAAVATGNVLIAGGVGTVSAWGKVGLTTHVSGILPTANGGTGIAFFTAAGPTQARVYTFPDAAATIARTDAANTFTGHQTIEGVTSTGATGTGNFVFATSPTLTTPALGTPSALVLTNATGLPEGGLSLTDITTGNATTSAHGFVPKFPGGTTTFLRADGTYAAPAGGGSVTSIATTSPISGGPITTTGTISLLTNVDFALTANQSLTGTGSSATSGTDTISTIATTWHPTSTSTLVGTGLLISPTINFSAGTPGAGSYEALRVKAIETAVPTGTNYLIRASAGSAGTTDVFTVTPGSSPVLTLKNASSAGVRLEATGAALYTVQAASTTLRVLNGSSSGWSPITALAIGLDPGGAVKWGSSNAEGTWDTFLGRGGAAATIQMGADINGAAINQTFQAANGIAGTNVTGGNLTVRPGAGTGTGAVSSYIVQTPTLGTTGTTAQTQATRLTINQTTFTLADALDMVFGTTTGTKHGTATSQKQSFWNAAPIVQPTTGVAASTFAANTSAIANDTATWDSYTIGQVVKALRNVGLLA